MCLRMFFFFVLPLILIVSSKCANAENEMITFPLSPCTREEDCNNKGSCIGLKKQPICFCDAEFTGSRCEKTLCRSEVECLGRGICAGDVESFTCLCEPGFRGKRCEINSRMSLKRPSKKKRSLLGWLRPCSSIDCNRRGLCIGTIAHHICMCFLGFSGDGCQHSVFDNIKPEQGGLGNVFRVCSADDCNNKGYCLGTKALPTCLCHLGWHGRRCEKSFFAQCDHGECSNNGMCIGSKSLYSCLCYHGFEGRRCQRAVGIPCDSTDCSMNGICVGVKGQETCICNFGFAGRRCELKLGADGHLALASAPCELKDCSYNGLCVGTKAAPVCLCNLGYLGPRCEIEPPCNSLLQCSGHGICLGTQKNYICSCNIGWTGTNCQFVA